MLLNMTSGLPNYLSNVRIKRTLRQHPRHRWTRAQVLDGLGSGLGPSQFAPGARYHYDDTNYIVLGGILQRVTRSSIERDFQRLIARRAGMTSATFVPGPGSMALMAHPYLQESDGALRDQWVPGFGVPTADWGPVWTDGGLASTTTDLVRFASALLNGRLLNAAALAEMTHTGRSHYGFGIQSRAFGGHRWLGHYGAYGGYEAEDWTDRARGVTIAVATNVQAAGQEPQLISDRIWRALVRTYDGQPGAGHTCPSA
jgi:D-alanyl-D-alanine carboxypeptidase